MLKKLHKAIKILYCVDSAHVFITFRSYCNITVSVVDPGENGGHVPHPFQKNCIQDRNTLIVIEQSITLIK